MSAPETHTTPRGFSLVEFVDRSGVACKIQKSSLATEDAIWFGATDIGVKHMKPGVGWADVDLTTLLGDQHVANNQMHLTQDTVRELLPVLQWFAETGQLLPTDAAGIASEPFQDRVSPWLLECFGEEVAGDREERNHRFLEEALELVQACGCTASEAHQLVDYVFARPVGESEQEAGGVMVTLAALCLANFIDMHDAGEAELSRVWMETDRIRAKQAAKPKHSPLPGAST